MAKKNVAHSKPLIPEEQDNTKTYALNFKQIGQLVGSVNSSGCYPNHVAIALDALTAAADELDVFSAALCSDAGADCCGAVAGQLSALSNRLLTVRTIVESVQHTRQAMAATEREAAE